MPLLVLVSHPYCPLQPHKHVDCGFERTIAANYFGHFYLTQLLLDDLKAGAPSRSVQFTVGTCTAQTLLERLYTCALVT